MVAARPQLGGHRLLDRLIFYLHERVTYGPRWKGALRDWPGRLELAWAELDPDRQRGGARRRCAG